MDVTLPPHLSNLIINNMEYNLMTNSLLSVYVLMYVHMSKLVNQSKRVLHEQNIQSLH